MSLGSQLSTSLTEDIDLNAHSEHLSNKSFHGSFRSVVSKYFGVSENKKHGATASLSSQNDNETSSSVSTQRSHSSATVQGTMTASVDIQLADVTLQSYCSDQGLATLSAGETAAREPCVETAAREPSVEKHAKKHYSYILLDLGSAIGKQDAAEDAGAKMSLALQTFSENAFVGTPAYASPETFVQQASSKLHSANLTHALGSIQSNETITIMVMKVSPQIFVHRFSFVRPTKYNTTIHSPYFCRILNVILEIVLYFFSLK
jgi:hypothetical protein